MTPPLPAPHPQTHRAYSATYLGRLAVVAGGGRVLPPTSQPLSSHYHPLPIVILVLAWHLPSLEPAPAPCMTILWKALQLYFSLPHLL